MGGRCPVTEPAALLLANIRLVHDVRDTCDEAGRPLRTYMCQYHEGFSDGLGAEGEPGD